MYLSCLRLILCTFHRERIVKELARERHALRKHTDCFPSFVLRAVKILCAPTLRAAGSRVCDAGDALAWSDERAISTGHVSRTSPVNITVWHRERRPAARSPNQRKDTTQIEITALYYYRRRLINQSTVYFIISALIEGQPRPTRISAPFVQVHTARAKNKLTPTINIVSYPKHK